MACSRPAAVPFEPDLARQRVPVPLCVGTLEAAGTGPVSIPEERYWALVWPSTSPAPSVAPTGAITNGTLDCTGRARLQDLPTAFPPQGSVRLGQAKVSEAAEGLRVAWLPSHQAGSRSAGALGILRRQDRTLEVVALGTLVGDPERTRLGLESLAGRLHVSATEEHCAAEGCDRTLVLHVSRAGQLFATAPIVLDRQANGRFRGAPARVIFSANPEYAGSSVRLTERLSVRVEGQGEVRSSSLSRTLEIVDTELRASSPSLWDAAQQEFALGAR